MKRKILCVSLAVVLIFVMSVPVFASSYEWGDLVLLFEAGPVAPLSALNPGSQYFVEICFYYDFEGRITSVRSRSLTPYVYDASLFFDGNTFVFADSSDFEPWVYNSTVDGVVFELYSKNGSLCVDIYERNEVHDGDLYIDWCIDSVSFYEAVPVGISLSDVVDSTTLSGVFNEFIAILPLSLGALVTFIGLRKAIACVKSFVHGA